MNAKECATARRELSHPILGPYHGTPHSSQPRIKCLIATYTGDLCTKCLCCLNNHFELTKLKSKAHKSYDSMGAREWASCISDRIYMGLANRPRVVLCHCSHIFTPFIVQCEFYSKRGGATLKNSCASALSVFLAVGKRPAKHKHLLAFPQFHSGGG